MNVVSFSELRRDLKEIMDDSVDKHEAVVVKRPKGENIILLSQSDYESLKETAYLLSNEANAKHLRKSIKSFKDDKTSVKKLIEE